MIAKLRARYANGVLTPLEPLDLEEGREVMVSIAEDSVQTARRRSLTRPPSNRKTELLWPVKHCGPRPARGKVHRIPRN